MVVFLISEVGTLFLPSRTTHLLFLAIVETMFMKLIVTNLLSALIRTEKHTTIALYEQTSQGCFLSLWNCRSERQVLLTPARCPTSLESSPIQVHPNFLLGQKTLHKLRPDQYIWSKIQTSQLTSIVRLISQRISLPYNVSSYNDPSQHSYK